MIGKNKQRAIRSKFGAYEIFVREVTTNKEGRIAVTEITFAIICFVFLNWVIMMKQNFTVKEFNLKKKWTYIRLKLRATWRRCSSSGGCSSNFVFASFF